MNHVVQVMETGDLDAVWRQLVGYVRDQGGHVHSSLRLGRSLDGQRGVFATVPIEPGTLLIRVSKPILDQDLSGGSPWLRCLASFWKLPADHPYILSLPESYETLWQWTDDEIDMYLAGTQPPVLGGTNGGWKLNTEEMRKRFEDQILPYFIKHKISATTKDYDRFAYACNTLATRGFHDGEKAGPFLLPIIDFLNHSSDENVTCTRLRRMEGGEFVMYAERKVIAGEELFHSYGTLTASQFLANFGFVPKLLMTARQQRAPVLLSKREVWKSCWFVVEELHMPQKLAKVIDPDSTECWEVCLDRTRDAPYVPDDIVIPPDDEILFTNELVTAACIPFLPQCAYSEITERTLLDVSILDDEFLGGLVIGAIQHLLDEKLKKYTSISMTVRQTLGVRYNGDRDRELLIDLLSLEVQSVSVQRLEYALAVRLEEQRSLHKLKQMLYQRYPIELDRFDTLNVGYMTAAESSEEKKNAAPINLQPF